VTLAAITPHEVVDLSTFDLVNRSDRIACIVRIIKLCRLLKPLQEVIGHRTDSEFVEIRRHFQFFCVQCTQLMRSVGKMAQL
jgi:hypothetical protein